jgi:hypothetical protein
LGEGILAEQRLRQILGERLNDGHFVGEPRVPDPGREGARGRKQALCPAGEAMDDGEKRGGGFRRREGVDLAACGGQILQRQVDAVQALIVLRAVLQVVDDLQGGAEGVGGGPEVAALPVDVEHEPADGHGAVATVVEQRGEGLVAADDDVPAEGLEELAGVDQGKPAPLRRAAEGESFRIGRGLPVESRLHGPEAGELVRGGGGRVVGHVVGLSGEAVEAHHRRAVGLSEDEGGDGEVLVAVALRRRARGVRRRHARPSRAWARPFQSPPRPRQTSRADFRVKPA